MQPVFEKFNHTFNCAQTVSGGSCQFFDLSEKVLDKPGRGDVTLFLNCRALSDYRKEIVMACIPKLSPISMSLCLSKVYSNNLSVTEEYFTF